MSREGENIGRLTACIDTRGGSAVKAGHASGQVPAKFDPSQVGHSGMRLSEPFLHYVDLDKILNGLKTLTPREHEVLNQVVSGRRNREIASELGLTIRTVKEYRGRVMEKMEAILSLNSLP